MRTYLCIVLSCTFLLTSITLVAYVNLTPGKIHFPRILCLDHDGSMRVPGMSSLAAQYYTRSVYNAEIWRRRVYFAHSAGNKLDMKPGYGDYSKFPVFNAQNLYTIDFSTYWLLLPGSAWVLLSILLVNRKRRRARRGFEVEMSDQRH